MTTFFASKVLILCFALSLGISHWVTLCFLRLFVYKGLVEYFSPFLYRHLVNIQRSNQAHDYHTHATSRVKLAKHFTSKSVIVVY